VIFPTNWGANWGAKLFKSSHLIVFNIFLDIIGGAVRLSSPSISPSPFNLACEFGDKPVRPVADTLITFLPGNKYNFQSNYKKFNFQGIFETRFETRVFLLKMV
jgi:hypothetical protein